MIEANFQKDYSDELLKKWTQALWLCVDKAEEKSKGR
jgi:hypothetical protein